MSKGDRPRPYGVSLKQFDNNFDAIFRKPDPKEIEDAQIEQEAFDKIEEKMYNTSIEGNKECK